MAHDIIMPALGMAQETGIIVAWKKQPGDAVKAADVVMEIETDKSTVEIEAGHDGYLARVLAETGVPVPVGQVVAIISADAADIDKSAPKASAPAEAPKPAAPAPAPAPQPAATKPAAAAAITQPKLPQANGGRILASPKARREAQERGIDLGRLVRLGVPQPIRSADIARAGDATGSIARTSLMRVTIERGPFEKFLSWIDSDANVVVEATVVWAAFAAGSLRRTLDLGNDAALVVNASGFAEENAIALTNPDLAGLRGLDGDAAIATPALTVLDLTATSLSDYRPAGERALPNLTIANGPAADYLDIVLEFDPAEMKPISALEFLKDLAERAHNPLRHLL